MAAGTVSSGPSGRVTGDGPAGWPERTLLNAPWALWAWPYGLVVPLLTLLWYALPLGWLWVVLALVAGVLVSLRSWGSARASGGSSAGRGAGR